jgi:hypothetical protein
VAILQRADEPALVRRGLPGDPDDTHSRYIEAEVNGLIVGCLYLPNGNPAPGPKFDYKLRWFERLQEHASRLLASGAPVVLAGDYNVMPTELDVYAPERWVEDALFFRPEVREAFRRLTGQGWTDSLRALHPNERIYTFWKYFRNAFARDAGLRTCTVGVVFFAHGPRFHRFDEIAQHLFGLMPTPLQGLDGHGELVGAPAGPRGNHEIIRLAIKLPYRLIILPLNAELLERLFDAAAGQGGLPA